MSVINQMLKDLENRSKPSLKHESILLGLNIHSDQQTKKKFRGWIYIIAVIFFILVVINKINDHTVTPIKTETLPTFIANPESELIKPLPAFRTARLTAISLQSEADKTNLSLLLNNPILYHINIDKNKRIVLYLENTKLEASLPLVNSIHSSIEDINIENLKNDLKIILTVKNKSILTNLELNELGSLSELQINFYDPEYLPKEQPTIINPEPPVPIKETATVKKILRYDAQLAKEYQLALRHLADGHKEDAIYELNMLLEKHPDYAPGREVLINALLAEKRIEDAESVLEIGLKSQPNYLPFVELKAKILLKNDHVKEALQTLLVQKPKIFENPNYYAFMAALYERQGDANEAKNIYQQLLGLQPDNSTWWIGLGIALENLDQKKAALQAYMRANKQDLSDELKEFVDSRINV